VALVDGPVVVDGDANMRKRPIRPLVTALAELGVRAEAATGCPPVTVHGRGIISGSRVSIDAGLSSQYVSALLMLAACGQGPIEVALTGDHIGARGYIDLTVAAMQAFGARVEQPSPVSGAWRRPATTPMTWRSSPTLQPRPICGRRSRSVAAPSIWARRPRPSPSPMPRPTR
jgi:3-phosphoshikimate 1-carboxyvinyltransferase